MEMEETHHSKRSRIGNIGHSKLTAGGGGGESGIVPWHHSLSRICRVSRTSGGKDRHSKVYTAKGIRDRRIRLSVSTAIQFYDIQDRLGYDQPSKAIEWLIKAASAAINKLPTLGEASYSVQSQQLTRTGCSSASETSKGSVLSLSARSTESPAKARERARERAATDKEKGREDDDHVASEVNPSVTSQDTFTELLTGGGSNRTAIVAGPPSDSAAECMQKQSWHLPPVVATADYFGQGSLFTQAQKTTTHYQLPSGFNVSPMATGVVPFSLTAAAPPAAGDHLEMQHFLQDNPSPVPAVAAPSAGEYNLNFSFSISPAVLGVNWGTLQSNSPSQIPNHQHLQRLSPIDGSNLPFFFGAAAPAAMPAARTSADNQLSAGFDGRLQLWDGYRQSDMKEEGKN